MIFTISSMEGRCEGSLDQQRVIRLSMGLGRSLIRGGLVPEWINRTNTQHVLWLFPDLQVCCVPWVSLSKTTVYLCMCLRPSPLQSDIPHWQKSTHLSALTIMNGPHNAKGWSSDFIKGLPASDHFPQNDAPAEHIALLTVITTCKYKTHFQNEEKWRRRSLNAHLR